MPIAATRTVQFVATVGLGKQYKALQRLFPEIAETIAIFNEYKREIPPRALPGRMNDHVLKGALDGIRECHLAADVLLLYRHEDDIVSMLKVCRHADLYGKRGKGTRRQAT